MPRLWVGSEHMLRLKALVDMMVMSSAQLTALWLGHEATLALWCSLSCRACCLSITQAVLTATPISATPATPDTTVAVQEYRSLRTQYLELKGKLQRSRKDNDRLLHEIKAYAKVRWTLWLPSDAYVLSMG